VSEPRASALAYLWRHHRPALIGLTLALVAALFFAVRLTVFTIYWSDPAHRDQADRGLDDAGLCRAVLGRAARGDPRRPAAAARWRVGPAAHARRESRPPRASPCPT
jgi:hypothetical protein